MSTSASPDGNGNSQPSAILNVPVGDQHEAAAERRRRSPYRFPRDARLLREWLSEQETRFKTVDAFRDAEIDRFIEEMLACIHGAIPIGARGNSGSRHVEALTACPVPKARLKASFRATRANHFSSTLLTCKDGLSLEPPETKLPEEVFIGVEPFLIVGAMAGG